MTKFTAAIILTVATCPPAARTAAPWKHDPDAKSLSVIASTAALPALPHFNVTLPLVTPWGPVPGVTANDNIDDTASVFMYLLLKDNCILEFPDGVIDLNANIVPFTVSNKNLLELSGSLGGARTVLRFHGFDPAIHGHAPWHPGSNQYRMGIHFADCATIRVHGIDTQTKRPPITEGSLVSINPTLHTATIAVSDPDLYVPYTGTAHMDNASGMTFSEPHGNPFWIGWIFARRPVTGPFPAMVRMSAVIYDYDSVNIVATAGAPHATTGIQTITIDYSGVWSGTAAAIDGQWATGDIIQFIHSPDDFEAAALSFLRSGPVTVHDCEIQSSGQIGCFSLFCSNVTTDNVRIVPQKPTWHFTTVRDGLDSWSATGVATVSNCYVSFTGDDAMSQDGGHWWRVHSVDANSQQMKLERRYHDEAMRSAPIFATGATLELSGMDLLPLASTQIAVQPAPSDYSGYYVNLKLTAPPSSSFWTHAVVDRPVRFPNSSPSSLTVQSCTLVAPRGLGVMVSDNCIVDQCVFVSVPDTPLLASNAYSLTAQYNGTQARNNISLTNNTFLECMDVRNSWPYPANLFRSTDSSVITVTSLFPNPITPTVLAASPLGAISNVVIQGNTIIGSNGAGIHVTSASNVLIDGNLFQDMSRLFLGTTSVPEAHLVFLENCAFTTVTNNTGTLPYNHNLGTINTTYTASGNAW